jgi:hypothetical protein
MGPHFNWLPGTARAQADARRLRGLYGADAEAWCCDALAALPAGDARRGDVRRILKALRALPASVGDRIESRPSVSRPGIAANPRRI